MPTTKRVIQKPKEHPKVSVSSPIELNRALSLLSRAQVQALADMSGVPFTTIYMRVGSRDMMLSTAHAIAKHLPAVRLLKLPAKGEYMAWRRRQRAEAIRNARAAVALD